MYAKKRRIILAISTAIILSLASFTPLERGAIASAQPGGFLSVMDGSFIETTTGFEYTFSLIARETEDGTDFGQATLLLNGPALSLCSAHGPGAEIDFSPGGEDFVGNNPLQEIQCGTAYGMAVAIDGCAATVELHGYSHSDYPLIAYMGPMTLELSFRKTAPQATSAQVSMKLYTVNGPTKLNGNLSAPIEMDTCN